MKTGRTLTMVPGLVRQLEERDIQIISSLFVLGFNYTNGFDKIFLKNYQFRQFTLRPLMRPVGIADTALILLTYRCVTLVLLIRHLFSLHTDVLRWYC